MSSNLDYSKIGKRIRSVRKERKLTQEDLAIACGCSSNHLSAIETGDHRPSLELIVSIATVLESSIDFFLMDSVKKSSEYIISSQIATQLGQCSPRELQLIERTIDEVLKYRNELLSSGIG